MTSSTTTMRRGSGVDRCGLGEGGGSFPLLPGALASLHSPPTTQPPPLSEEPGGLLSSPVGSGPYQGDQQWREQYKYLTQIQISNTKNKYQVQKKQIPAHTRDTSIGEELETNGSTFQKIFGTFLGSSVPSHCTGIYEQKIIGKSGDQ